MATKIVKTLEFPGSTDEYQINAVALNGTANYAGSESNGGPANSVKGTLTFGEKTFNGSTDIELTAEDLGLSSAMKFLGTSATAISDGSTTNPITIGSTSITVTAGGVVLYGGKEFVWTGSAWEQLGQEGSFKVVQTAVSDPTASGTGYQFIATITQNTQGVISATKRSVREASISQSGLMTPAMFTQLNNVSSKVSSLTTDDLDGGEETWYFDCGTSTTVID